MSLLSEIAATDFSADAIGLFQSLTLFDASDEVGKAVLSAAATLLAAKAVSAGRDIFDLIDEFGDLAETLELSLRAKMADQPAA